MVLPFVAVKTSLNGVALIIPLMTPSVDTDQFGVYTDLIGRAVGERTIITEQQESHSSNSRDRPRKELARHAGILRYSRHDGELSARLLTAN